VSLGTAVVSGLLVGVLLVAVWGVWFGHRLLAHNRRLLARLAELEQQFEQPQAVTAPHPGGQRAVRSDRPLLVIMSSQLGLFAEFMKVLASLDHLADDGRTPIVYFNQATFLYWSDSGWNGAYNGWEYYFHPLCDHSLPEVLGVHPGELTRMTRIQIDHLVGDEIVINDRLLQGNFDMFGDVRSGHRERYVGLCRDHIRVREEVLEKVDSFVRVHFDGRRVIGVHFRATDKMMEIGGRLESAGWSTDALAGLELDSYLDEALRRAEDDDLIFMATEDAQALDLARDRLGDRLIASDAARTREPLPLFLTSGDAAHGEEALIDCLLLARCDYLVHGVSNLSWAARMFNPDLPHINLVAKLITPA
jgi:hypothetical protein